MRLSLRCRLAACFAAAVFGPGAAVARAGTATGDPSSNRPLSNVTLQACQSDPLSQSCVSSALADINAARAAEGVTPMVLPAGFGALGVPEQLLVLANLERVARGLTPALGLSAALNRDAAAGAAADSDPSPAHWYGDAYAANWAGGFPSPLEAEFAWMYDDGPGSGNLDCTSTDTAGCWGHRHDILMDFDAPLVMGAAETTGGYGTSIAELFVGGDTETGAGQPDQPLAPDWATLSGQSSSPATPPPPATAAAAPRIVLTRAPDRVVRGHRVALAGTVSPAGPGRRVELERWNGRGWTVLATVHLGANAGFSFALWPSATGRLRLRVALPGAGGTASRAVTVRVTR